MIANYCAAPSRGREALISQSTKAAAYLRAILEGTDAVIAEGSERFAWFRNPKIGRSYARRKTSSQVTDPASGRTKQIIELEPFEFKVRERIVLTPISDRGGSLPDVSDLEDAGMELNVHEMAG